MKISRAEIEAIRNEVRYGPYRSTLFAWMVEHHDDLVQEGRKGRMPWAKLCKRFITYGLTDGSGKAPTTRRAAKTWIDACAEVAAAAERRKAANETRNPHPPSRQRDDWRPTETVPTPPARPTPAQVATTRAREPPPPSVAPGPGDGKKKITYDDLPPEAKAQFDKLREAFAETDRKRFGSF